MTATTHSLHILLAEDNFVNQTVVSEMLKSLGYSCVVVSDGQACVDMLREQRFDLVLMDCEMPVMSGVEAVRLIRDQAVTSTSGKPLPIIALTANDEADFRNQCLAAGLNNVLTKPCSRNDLAAVLNQWTASDNLPIPRRNISNSSGDILASEPLDNIRTLQRPDAPNLLNKIIDLYFESAPELLTTLSDSIEQADAEKVRAAAHSLKSSSANLGAHVLAALCKTMEDMGRHNDLAEAQQLLVQIQDSYASACVAMRSLQSDSDGTSNSTV